MSQKIRSAKDLDQAIIEQRCLEEIASVARRYIPRLDLDSDVRAALVSLEGRAPQEHPQAA